MASTSRKTSAAAAASANVTVSDADVLKCGVCFLPLRPPIFQCEVGHVVCSACRDKMEATGRNGNCHVCGVATRGYRRCHAMEKLVDSTRVACPYAAYGCGDMTPYHGQESHRQVCRYAPSPPCHCPGESCGFIGSVAALLDHFVRAHKWPCTTKSKVSASTTLFSIRLRVGFNVLVLVNDDHDCGDPAGTVACCVQLLFLLNVTHLEGIGRAISVLCIHPYATAEALEINNGVDPPVSVHCELAFTRNTGPCLLSIHSQQSEFDVVCTDLSNGLPSPDGRFQLIVPSAVLEDDDDKHYMEVKARINIVRSMLSLELTRIFRAIFQALFSL